MRYDPEFWLCSLAVVVAVIASWGLGCASTTKAERARVIEMTQADCVAMADAAGRPDIAGGCAVAGTAAEIVNLFSIHRPGDAGHATDAATE